MYFNSPSSPRIGISVEFFDHSGTKRLRASISSPLTLYKAFAASTVPYGMATAVAPKPNNL